MNSNSTDAKHIRKFGLIALIFFGFLCGLGIWKEKLFSTYFFGTLSLIGIGFILIPISLQPVYTAWLKIARLIGKIVTIIILTLAYYFAITPMAVIKRLLSGTPIPVRHDRETSSYWVDRTEPIQPKERFLKRF